MALCSKILYLKMLFSMLFTLINRYWIILNYRYITSNVIIILQRVGEDRRICSTNRWEHVKIWKSTRNVPMKIFVIISKKKEKKNDWTLLARDPPGRQSLKLASQLANQQASLLSISPHFVVGSKTSTVYFWKSTCVERDAREER